MKSQESTVKSRPILFSTEMILAILDGRKTQTRRVIKPQPNLIQRMAVRGGVVSILTNMISPSADDWIKCPYGKPGDLLWVRETWRLCPECGAVNFRASHDNGCCSRCDALLDTPWKPSIHMFRDYARITLRVSRIWAERIQDITVADCVAEGIDPDTAMLSIPASLGVDEWADQELRDQVTRLEFSALWDGINAKRGYSWNANPWSWVVEWDDMEVTA